MTSIDVSFSGRGIVCKDCGLSLDSVGVTDCSASDGDGGGLYVDSSIFPYVEGSLFVRNTAPGRGGAVFVTSTYAIFPTFLECSFEVCVMSLYACEEYVCEVCV